MPFRSRAARLALLVALTLAPAAALPDASTETRLREALRAATSQVRTLEDEKARLQESEAALRKEVESLRARKSQAAGSDARAIDLERRLAGRTEAASQAVAALERCQGEARAAAEALGGSRAESERLGRELTALQARLAAADERNARMLSIGKHILDWIDGLGPGAAWAAREPFTGLKRVELENVSQDWRDRLLEQKAGR